MNANGNADAAVLRGGAIAARSRIASAADAVVRRSTASVRSSRVLAVAREQRRQFLALPVRERAQCGLIALAAALAGHVLLAARLPPSTSPTITLTVVGLLGAALAAVAAARHR